MLISIYEGQSAWSGRCDCRNNHASSSGRCNTRQCGHKNYVQDPTRPAFDENGNHQTAICADCREHCPIGNGPIVDVDNFGDYFYEVMRKLSINHRWENPYETIHHAKHDGRWINMILNGFVNRDKAEVVAGVIDANK